MTARLRFSWCSWLWLALAGVQAGAAEVVPLHGLDFGALPVRAVAVHLPPGRITPGTPVLVALDGQQMDAWRLDETMSRLAAAGRIEAPLVVAVAAGPDRLAEYGTAGGPDYAGRGRRAAEFERFVVASVLPAVRAQFGVAAEPARTGVMGSSLGGLTAFDLAWRHPDAFGFAGIFSGSFWWRGDNGSPAAQQASRLAHRLVRGTTRAPHLRLWFEAGTHDEKDDRDHNGVIDSIQDTTELMDAIAGSGLPRGPDLRYVEIPGGEHNEATWASALPGFLEWALPRR